MIQRQLSPMEVAIAREKANRERDAAHGTSAVLDDLASHIRQARYHRICMDCRLIVFVPTIAPHGKSYIAPEFDAKVCTCENPRMVETVW